MAFRLIGLVILLLWAAAELAVLARVADAVGALATILLLVAVGLVGLSLVRSQGMATLLRARAALDAGRPPVADLFDGACILVAGVLLVLPGFLSDVAACALLLPPVRRLLYKALARRARAVQGARPREQGPIVIEGQYEEVEPVSDRSDDDERRRPRR